MTFQELMQTLRNSEGGPINNYTLQDYDGNSIESYDLYVLDYNAILTWIVESVIIDDDRRITIHLNSGNFKSFNFRNVY